MTQTNTIFIHFDHATTSTTQSKQFYVPFSVQSINLVNILAYDNDASASFPIQYIQATQLLPQSSNGILCALVGSAEGLKFNPTTFRFNDPVTFSWSIKWNY